MRVTIAPGENLWDAINKNNVILERPCGGKGICGMCRAYVQGVGEVKSCRFTRPGSYEVRLMAEQQYHTVFADADEKSPGELRHPAAAVDIGTTTVAILAVYRDHQARRSFVNPQRQYGADVVSRIEAANAGKGEKLRALLLDRLQRELAAAYDELGVPEGAACQVVIGANTAMLHLLRGFSCEGLGQAPFRPVDLAMGGEQWLCGGRCFSVTYLPGISAYIGADIVSGLYGLGVAENEEIVFLLDLGTNGEMAVGNGERLLCASAAAGPAFEGSPLAVKIHAAGILNVLHRMRSRGVMDEYGLLQEPYFSEGYPAAPDQELRVTQDDIRNIQMAKGAVRAGIEILLREYKITAAQVDRVYLAGGMGYYLAPEDAAAIGLIPKEFLGKTEAVGNSCLRGALQYIYDQNPGEAAINPCPDKRMAALAECAEEVVLAEHKDFPELYISMMNFCDDADA